MVFVRNDNLQEVKEELHDLLDIVDDMISVALTEEIKMTKEANKSYLEYRDSTPFMFPLPKSISKMITAPQRILFKKGFPISGKQILCNLVIYLAILVMLSVIFQALGLNWRFPAEEPVIR